MDRKPVTPGPAACLLTASLMLTAPALAEDETAETEEAPEHDAIGELTRQDLEGIRQAAIEYYENGKSEDGMNETFLAELKRGALFLAREQPDVGTGIGMWRVEIGGPGLVGDRPDDDPDLEDHGLILVRPPPMPLQEVGVYFAVHLARRDGRWTVLDDFYWEEWYDLE